MWHPDPPGGHPESHPEPEHDPRRDAIYGEEDLLATNPYRPGEDLAVLKNQARDLVVIPDPVVFHSVLQPEVAAFKKAVEPFREVAASRGLSWVAPKVGTKQEAWNTKIEIARSHRACLGDFWRDAIDHVQMSIQRQPTKEPEKRSEYGTKFKELIAGSDTLLADLSNWQRLRQTFPLDWQKLHETLNNIKRQVENLNEKLTEAYSSYPTTNLALGLNPLQLAIHATMTQISALGYEVARQGAELTDKPAFDYGSAVEAAAGALATNTRQNSIAAAAAAQLSGVWKESLLRLPKGYGKYQESWGSEVISKVGPDLTEFDLATRQSNIDYDDVESKANLLQVEISVVQYTIKTDFPDLKEYVKGAAQDRLTIIQDELCNRLRRLIDGADLEHAQNINQFLVGDKDKDLPGGAKDLREPTTTEVLAEKVDEVGVAKFYVDAKAQFLTNLGEQTKGGSELKASLGKLFQKGLTGHLKAFNDEIGNVPNHNREVLHNAVWNIRYIIREYKYLVEEHSVFVFNKDKGESEEVWVEEGAATSEFQTSLDALSFSVSNRLRKKDLEGFSLF
jgi:hypothetical protein